MNDQLYAFIGFVAVLIFILIRHCNRKISGNEEYSSLFHHQLTVLIIFSFFDGLWGLIANRAINWGSQGLSFITYMFHLLATHTAFRWYYFTRKSFSASIPKGEHFLETIPLLIGVGILAIQPFNHIVFTVDENINYIIGPHRKFLYIIQTFYFALCLIMSLIHLIKNSVLEDRNRILVSLEYSIVLVLSTIFQSMFPDAPYLSTGFVLASIIVFNGNIVIERDRQIKVQNHYNSRAAEETFRALTALAQEFMSIHLIDLKIDKSQEVKSISLVDEFIDTSRPASLQIKDVMRGVSGPETLEEILDFVDFSSLNGRMLNKQSISQEFISKNGRYCLSNFIVVERDPSGLLTKVIHATQDINDMKMREKEYEENLAKAYENQNAIYAELLKMQSTGVIATDMSETLILANDMALSMFNHPIQDVKGMRFEEFIHDAIFMDMENTISEYKHLLEDGKAISYCMKVDTWDGKERFLKAEGRMLSLLDKEKVILTCYTDITESKNLEDALRLLSETDSLTQIDNRRSGESKISLLLSEKTPGLFCVIDVNDFKEINDSFGHQVGDEVLIAIANALRESFRSNDIFIRIGGDEFALFAKNITSDSMAEDRIRNLFRKIGHIAFANAEGLNVSISLGATFVRKDSDAVPNFSNLYEVADAAMYRCKGRAGSNFYIAK